MNRQVQHCHWPRHILISGILVCKIWPHLCGWQCWSHGQLVGPSTLVQTEIFYYLFFDDTVYIHGPQRMMPTDFGNPLTFSQAPPRGFNEIPQKLLNGLPSNPVLTFMPPSGQIAITLSKVEKQLRQHFGQSAPLSLSPATSPRHIHFLGTLQTCHYLSIHQMSSDFPTKSSHLTPISTWSPVSHSPITSDIPAFLLTCSWQDRQGCNVA